MCIGDALTGFVGTCVRDTSPFFKVQEIGTLEFDWEKRLLPLELPGSCEESN